MMDSFRLECNNGFAIQKNQARKTITKKSMLLPPSSVNTNAANIKNSNFTIISQPPTNSSIQQTPLFFNVSQQQLALASFGQQGINSFATQPSTISPFALTTTPSQSTFCAPIGTTNHNIIQQPIIVGAPNSIFLPNIGANLSRPSTSGIARRAGTSGISRTASLPNESQTLSSSQINRLNLSNSFQNHNNFKQQLVTSGKNSTQLLWDYAPEFTQHQQPLKQPRQRKSSSNKTAPAEFTKSDNKQQNIMNSTNGVNNLTNHGPTLPLNDPSLTDNDLIKLMAVLNNPALTLTPVSNSTSSCSNSHMVDESDEFFNNSGYVTMNKSLVGLKPWQSFRKTKSGDTISQPPKSVSNIIQSTQNMTRPNILHSPQTSNLQRPNSNSIAGSSIKGSIPFNKKSIQSSNESSLITRGNIGYNDKTSFTFPRLTNQAIAQSTFMSTSVKNLIMQQPTLNFNLASDRSISKHLMQHIANHSKESTTSQLPTQQDIYYQDFVTDTGLSDDNMNSVAIIPTTTGQRVTSNSFDTFSDSQINKVSEWMNQSSTQNQIAFYPMDQSYPLEDDMGDWSSDINFTNDHVDSSSPHLELHHPLHDSLADPDEIFINRPKRIMSKIDTMVEKRRKRRFEKICQEPIILSDKSVKSKDSLIDENDETDSEQDFVLDGLPENYDYASVISNQLPLENDMSKEKAEYLSNVSLLSLKAKNNLLAEQCSERQKQLRCPLGNICFHDLPDRTKRIFNAMVTTRGYDLQLKIGTSFRRNDLSEIEGLDRCSSRIKLTYMNLLGMAKKNRRTALYRVKTVNEDGERLQDLNNQYLDASLYRQESTLMSKLRQSLRQQLIHDTDTVDSMIMSSMKPYRLTKNQYMNSLGLSNIRIEMTACQ